MIELKSFEKADIPFWLSLENHIAKDCLIKKIKCGNTFIIVADGINAGIMDYVEFWDNLPFLKKIVILPDFRGKGVGRKAMSLWEDKMKSSGYSAVLTSTQSDEQAQCFYRKTGYSECGCLVLENTPLSQPMEMFFIKKL